MISNNATSVFRYNPATTVLEEWKELNEVNVEFAGLWRLFAVLRICSILVPALNSLFTFGLLYVQMLANSNNTSR